MKIVVCAAIFCMATLSEAHGQRTVSFPLVSGAVGASGSAQVSADIYGNGTRGLILAHGGRFGKESWKDQAEVFAKHGFLVLALQFRGDRQNPDGSTGAFGSGVENAEDVMSAVAYLQGIGAKSISAVGGSLGGYAVSDADARLKPGTFDRIVVLGAPGGDEPEKLTGRKLFLVAREDRSGDGLRLPEISTSFAKVPEPKRLVVVEGSAHAQYLFRTEQGSEVLDTIVRFLTEP